MSKQWVVISTKSADKQATKLSQNVLLLLHLLFEDDLHFPLGLTMENCMIKKMLIEGIVTCKKVNRPMFAAGKS